MCFHTFRMAGQIGLFVGSHQPRMENRIVRYHPVDDFDMYKRGRAYDNWEQVPRRDRRITSRFPLARLLRPPMVAYYESFLEKIRPLGTVQDAPMQGERGIPFRRGSIGTTPK